MRRFLAPLLIALVILVALLFGVAWMPLRQARDAWRAGDNARAAAIAGRWSQLHLWPAQYDQVLAAAYLSAHNRAAAQPHLDALAARHPWVSMIAKGELAPRVSYDDFLAYDAASHERDTPAVLLARAAAQTATGRIAEASATFRSVDRSQVDKAKADALANAIAQRQQGSYPLVFDRNGQPIAVYQIANKDLVAINRDFEALVDARAGALTIGAQLPRLGVNDSIDTTLDPEVQKAAMQALGGFRGSLVAIDPTTNELLAVASTRGHGELANLAFERQYEPGSVVKTLTGLNAYESGIDLKSMFPYHCTGELLIDGRHFGDWLPQGHGILPTLDDALAQSCNIVFADIGLRLGADRLHRFMAAAGFDGQTDLGLMQVPLGKTIGQTFNHFETAFFAIGLEHESINALHLAMIGAMLANRGTMTSPRLFRDRRSILGETTWRPPAQGRTVLAKRENGEAMVRAMTAVAQSPKGTGRRAPVEGVPMAMKTGTAGERKGLEALIVAFAPVEQPKIAFGIIAEDAGPAEFAGAKIAHDFVAALKPRL
jgi:penicillin-binding protein A